MIFSIWDTKISPSSAAPKWTAQNRAEWRKTALVSTKKIGVRRYASQFHFLCANNPMTTFLGNFALFFLKYFSLKYDNETGSQSHSQRISQFLFQPNARKHLLSFEVPTVAGSCSLLRNAAQISVSTNWAAHWQTTTNRAAQCGAVGGNMPIEHSSFWYLRHLQHFVSCY